MSVRVEWQGRGGVVCTSETRNIFALWLRLPDLQKTTTGFCLLSLTIAMTWRGIHGASSTPVCALWRIVPRQ